MRQVLSVVAGLVAWFAAFNLLVFVIVVAAGGTAGFGPLELALAAAFPVPVGIWAGRAVARRFRPA